MKNKYFIIALFIIISVFLISAVLYSGGSPGAKTGSPLDGGNCTQCHSGTAIPQVDWITTTIPVDGYIPGETYEITVTGTHTGVGKFGFELTSEISGSKTGTFIITDATNTKLINSNEAVTHTSSGTTPIGDSKSWTCEWTAPVDGTGDVTFYAALNAADGTGGTTGDVIYLTDLLVQEDNSVQVENLSQKISVHPNPASDYIIISSETLLLAVNLYEIGGKLVKEFNINNSSGLKFDISEINPGTYILCIDTENLTTNKKLIVQ